MRIPSSVAEREKLKQIVTPTRQELARRDSEVMMCACVVWRGRAYGIMWLFHSTPQLEACVCV